MSCLDVRCAHERSYFYARTSGGAQKRLSKLSRPNVPRGTLVTGRIVSS